MRQPDHGVREPAMGRFSSVSFTAMIKAAVKGGRANEQRIGHFVVRDLFCSPVKHRRAFRRWAKDSGCALR